MPRTPREKYLPDLAAELRLPYGRVLDRALRGELGKLERRGKRWVVVTDAASSTR